MLNKSAVKYIQSLQHKKFRDENHVFVAEGPKVVRELMSAHVFPCTMICALREWLDDNKELTQNIPTEIIHEVAPHELEKISSHSTPNQVLAVFGQRESSASFVVQDPITLVLDQIQDPGNLGTIIRTADWFGIRNIICSLNTVDVYNSKVVQSTMASLARVHVHYTDLHTWLKAQQHTSIYAMMLQGEKITNVKWNKPAIIIIGNESKGIRESLLLDGVKKITIPGNKDTESLNAAVAASIVLYAAAID